MIEDIPDPSSPRNWTEDFPFENGQYICRCAHCKHLFLGHKRRGSCKSCAPVPANLRKDHSMSGGPIARSALLDSLHAHMAAKLGIDPACQEEMDGVGVMAEAAIDYFMTSMRGAPGGAGQTLLWAVFSALWEGHVDQGEINRFFESVNCDPGRMMHAWRALSDEERAQPHSVVLVPGSLSTADIAAVTAALFRSRGADLTPSA